MYKFLTDRNPDGSVSYSQEDMEIIADEHQFEQNFIKDYRVTSSILSKATQRTIDILKERSEAR